MFLIAIAGAVVFIVAIVLPPDFDQWERCKLMLLSNNPLVYSAGFVMCTFYAIEFIIWYLVILQGLRLLGLLLPFVFAYLVFKAITLKPEDVSKVKDTPSPPSIMQTLSPSLESQDELIRRQRERERSTLR